MGTYSASGATACLACTAGYACGGISLTATTGECPIGYYCPVLAGATTINACPAGTYGTITKATSSAQCTPCAAGYYCVGGPE